MVAAKTINATEI